MILKKDFLTTIFKWSRNDFFQNGRKVDIFENMGKKRLFQLIFPRNFDVYAFMGKNRFFSKMIYKKIVINPDIYGDVDKKPFF